MSSVKINELEDKASKLALALQIEKLKQEMISQYCDCGIWEYDIDGKCLIQSKKLNGKWSHKNLNVENYRETMRSWGRIHPNDVDIFEAYCDSMDAGEKNFSYELRTMTDDSKFIWIRYEGTTVFDEKGVPYRVVGKTVDITKEKQEQHFFKEIAIHDSLTKLYNKATTKELIEKYLSESDSDTGNGFLMIIDLDDFTKINDTWGNLYGDSILESAASIIYTNFTSSDIVGRISGDQFMAFCVGHYSTSEASGIANRLLSRTRNFIELKDKTSLMLSAGIAFSPQDATDFDSLYRNADMALYQAKQNGKNDFALYHKNMIFENAVGETRRKQWYNKVSSPSIKDLSCIEKELFDYSFEVLTQTPDLIDAIMRVFAEIGLYFNFDRLVLVEYNRKRKKAEVIVQWQKNEGKDDTALIARSSEFNWKNKEVYFTNQEYYMMNDGYSAVKNYLEMKAKMHYFPITMIQFPIMDGSVLKGTITLESWIPNAKMSLPEITTLSSIAKMIANYLLRFRSKKELDAELLYTGTAMDMQKLAYYVIDEKTYEITYISRYATEYFPSIHLGKKCYRSIRNRSFPCKDCPINDLSEKCNQCSTEIYVDSTESWHTITASALPQSSRQQDAPKQLLICWSDVTAFLERVKATDQLTGLYSYDKFRTEALRLIADRSKSYSIAYVGILDFAHINDEFGFSVGDDILKNLAEIAEKSSSQSELICRIKGDDFVFLLENNPNLLVKDRVYQTCVLLNTIMQERYPNINLRCFSGIYDVQTEDFSVSSILDKAAKARKEALDNFYQCDGIYVYTEEYAKQEQEELEMQRRMTEAMQYGNYVVYFQPKVDLKTGKIAGAEALVRLFDIYGNMISPAAFIPLAEKTGYVVEIDKVVYEKSMNLIRQWKNEGKHVPVISLNLSRLHLYRDDLTPYVRGLLDKYELEPSQIELEITESVFFADTDRLIQVITQLKDIGCQISMDDFGSGFSTLSLMKSLPLDVLKIDGSFFLQSKLDDKNKAVISSIIHLAKNLNFEVITEGIETKEQADFAKDEGSDCAQGYYFYKPMPADEFAKLLEDV